MNNKGGKLDEANLHTIHFIETSSKEKYVRLCQVVEHLYIKGLRVQIFVKSTTDSFKLNQLLWAFSPDSFVPHCLADTESDEVSINPVVICMQEEKIREIDTLVTFDHIDFDILLRFTKAAAFYGKNPRAETLVCVTQNHLILT